MSKFYVSIKRHQTQVASFVVDSKDEQSLRKRLEELEAENNFAELDECFDGGEVESIDYEVSTVEPTNINSVDEDFQDLL